MPVVLTTWPGPGGAALTLRPLAEHDAEALQVMIDDPDVRAALLWEPDQRRDAASFVGAMLEQEQRVVLREYHAFGVVPDGSAALAGVVIVKVGRKDVGSFEVVLSGELTFFLSAGYRGHGYSTLAVARVRDWCFDELEVTGWVGETSRLGELCAVCLPENAPSQAVLSRILGPGVRLVTREGVDALKFAQARAEYEA